MDAAERLPHRELVRRELAGYAGRIRLLDLVREHGSPLLVLDTDRVTTRLLDLRRELPGVRMHFAVTAFPHPAVIRAVDAFGASFAVATRGEIDLLEHEGVAIRRCLHMHPVKTVADITGAYLRGIRTFVVDSPAEVAKFAGLPRDVAVLVRLAFPVPGSISGAPPKFGVEPAAAPALVEQCLRAGLRVAGFSIDVGTQVVTAAPWANAVRRTLALMHTLEQVHRIRFELLDLGGGLPVEYDQPVPRLGELARGIRSALAGAPAYLQPVMEPGRFVVAPAMTLVSRVIGAATRHDGRWLYLDDGVHGAYANIPAEHVHPLVFAASELDVQPVADPATERTRRRLAARSAVPVTLAGPTSDGADVIARGAALPPLGEGDLLVSPMMGAHPAAAARGFNGIAPTPIVVIPS